MVLPIGSPARLRRQVEVGMTLNQWLLAILLIFAIVTVYLLVDYKRALESQIEAIESKLHELEKTLIYLRNR